MKNKGKLIRWNADRGFGFIKSPDIAEDIFIHISELKMMSRSPQVNDVIFFDLLDGKAGKKKAINATIEGVSLKLSTRSEKKPQKIHIASNIISFIVIFVAFFAAYKTYPKWSNKIVKTLPVNFVKEDFTGFRCEGKQYCSQMTSCKEARFYLKNCPNVQIDGNKDGVPCESQWCN